MKALHDRIRLDSLKQVKSVQGNSKKKIKNQKSKCMPLNLFQHPILEEPIKDEIPHFCTSEP